MKYKQLGNTGVLVSELCFGTMTFGGRGRWQNIGELGQKEANELVKASFDAGINFYDTANVYSEGHSEELLGKAIKESGISRQKVVVATKVRGRVGDGANQVGLSQLHIKDAVDDSLRRLGMDHIDLYYIHGVDSITPMEETLRGLEDVVRSGKVRYIGISNHAAWQIMKAHGISDKNGWARFVACQHFYTIASRDLEREVIPMIEDQHMGLMPWSPLAGGFLSGKYRKGANGDEKRRRDNFDFPPIDKDKALDVVEVMDEIATKHKVSIAQIALAWLLHQSAVTSVIIGAKRMDQLQDNIHSTEVKLSEEDLQKLDEVSALKVEYPAWMINFQGQERMPE